MFQSRAKLLEMGGYVGIANPATSKEYIDVRRSPKTLTLASALHKS